MTHEEAIHDLRYCERVTFDSFNLLYLKVGTANLAIEALEKQIPKKPDFERNMFGGKFDYCPKCKADIGYEQTYCHECGQAILWEDTE